VKVEGGRELNSYRKLIVWQKAMTLAKDIYTLTQSFPKEELYGLTSQLRRCAVSIPSNIAEGRGRGGDKEFIRFLQIALGSLYELQTQLELSVELGFAHDNEKIFMPTLELEKMLNKLITSKGGRHA
jgi:four helix bundle protein